MKLRLCSIKFQNQMKVQIGGGVRIKNPGDTINFVELGNIESYGKDHIVGVISEDIVNIEAIKRNIDNIEKMNIDDRIEWFSVNYPEARMIKIESGKVFDRLKDTGGAERPSAVVGNAVDIKWSK